MGQCGASTTLRVACMMCLCDMRAHAILHTRADRYDVSAHHVWMFIARKDVPNTWRISELDGPGHEQHALDVVLVAKQHVWSTQACRLVVAFPFYVLRGFATPSPTTLRPPKPPGENAEVWLNLGMELCRVYPRDARVARTARYLLSLAQGERAQEPLPALPWFNCARGDQEQLFIHVARSSNTDHVTRTMRGVIIQRSSNMQCAITYRHITQHCRMSWP